MTLVVVVGLPVMAAGGEEKTTVPVSQKILETMDLVTALETEIYHRSPFRWVFIDLKDGESLWNEDEPLWLEASDDSPDDFTGSLLRGDDGAKAVADSSAENDGKDPPRDPWVIIGNPSLTEGSVAVNLGGDLPVFTPKSVTKLNLTNTSWRDCWVAREVYGEQNPKWTEFRDWLRTRAPDWFHSLYLKHGEQFANWLSQHAWLNPPIRLWMDSRISHQHSSQTSGIQAEYTGRAAAK